MCFSAVRKDWWPLSRWWSIPYRVANMARREENVAASSFRALSSFLSFIIVSVTMAFSFSYLLFRLANATSAVCGWIRGTTGSGQLEGVSWYFLLQELCYYWQYEQFTLHLRTHSGRTVACSCHWCSYWLKHMCVFNEGLSCVCVFMLRITYIVQRATTATACTMAVSDLRTFILTTHILDSWHH